MTPKAVLAFNRFGLGARAGDLDWMGDDPVSALADDIADRKAAVLSDDFLLPSNEVLIEADAFHDARMQRGGGGGGSNMGMEDAEGDAEPDLPGRRPLEFVVAEMEARIDRALAADIGFAERLTAFWANHFAVEADASGFVRSLTGSFEREAIRPHVLGRFEDMLIAATQHPAMLLYLNNVSSVGPNSEAGQRRGRGLNENHAREILELHTLGVNGGYTQEDVTEFAKVLTGWAVRRNPNRREGYGEFVFLRNSHEPGPASVLGKRYPQPGVRQGEAVLRALAADPATADHISRKFARYFVADDPPPALVERLAATFTDTEGDLQALALTLIESDEAWGSDRKLKCPQEFLWSSLRALELPLPARQAIRTLITLGQPIWDPPSPEGFADDTGTWLAPDALTDRLDVAEIFGERARVRLNPSELLEAILGPAATKETRDAVAFAESPAQGFALVLMSPEFQWR